MFPCILDDDPVRPRHSESGLFLTQLGTEIPLQSIQPGDILQFTTARFDEPGYWAIMGTPNHTAVVYSLGDRTFILHQNVGGKKNVQTFDLDFDNLTSGRVQAFRPVPRTR